MENPSMLFEMFVCVVDKITFFDYLCRFVSSKRSDGVYVARWPEHWSPYVKEDNKNKTITVTDPFDPSNKKQFPGPWY